MTHLLAVAGLVVAVLGWHFIQRWAQAGGLPEHHCGGCHRKEQGCAQHDACAQQAGEPDSRS